MTFLEQSFSKRLTVPPSELISIGIRITLASVVTAYLGRAVRLLTHRALDHINIHPTLRDVIETVITVTTVIISGISALMVYFFTAISVFYISEFTGYSIELLNKGFHLIPASFLILGIGSGIVLAAALIYKTVIET